MPLPRAVLQQPSHWLSAHLIRVTLTLDPPPHACFVLGSALASPGSGLNDVLSEANTDQDSFLVCFPSHQAQITGRPGFLLSGPRFFPSLLKPYDVGGTFI